MLKPKYRSYAEEEKRIDREDAEKGRGKGKSEI